MRLPGRRPTTFRPRVLEAEPARRLRWLGHLLVPGLFDGEHRFTIEPAGPGLRDPAGDVPRPAGPAPAGLHRRAHPGGLPPDEPGPRGPGRGADPHPGDPVTAATPTRAREAVAAGRRLLEEEGTAAIIATGLEEAAEAFEAAVDGADEPLPALAAAYRGFALAHPHLYRLMNNGPLPRQHLPPGLEDRTAAPSCGSPAARPAPAPCGRSPTAWSCSSSTTGSRPTPTWTAPGRPASPPSNRPDRRLGMVRPVVRGSDGRDGGAR
jgi:hypothetical protein